MKADNSNFGITAWSQIKDMVAKKEQKDAITLKSNLNLLTRTSAKKAW